MARRNIIEFLIRAKDQASPELNKVQKGIAGVESGVKRLAAAVGVGFAAKQVAAYADQWRLLENRIKLVTKSTLELNTVQRELVDLALRSRTGFEATAQLYARVARSSRELGLSQQELLDFTETVSKSIRVSGSTAAEATAGVIQFGQALASSRLSGDELRSVLEQMPRLAQAIADGLGVGIGRLREMGEAGELTTDAVLGALRKEAPKIQQEFEKLAPLVSESFVNLQSALISTIGKIDEFSGISASAASLILTLAEDVKDLGDAYTGTLEPGQKVSDTLQRIAIFAITTATTVKLFAKSLVDSFGFISRSIAGAGGALGAQIEALFHGNFAGAQEVGTGFKEDLLKDFEGTFTNLGDDLSIELIEMFDKLGKLMNDGTRILNESSNLKLKGNALEALTKPQLEAIRSAETQLKNLEKSLLNQRSALLLSANSGMEYSDALDVVKIKALAATAQNEELGFALQALLSDILGLSAEAADNKVLENLQSQLSLLRLTNRERAIQEELLKLSAQATSEQREAVARAAGELFDRQKELAEQTKFMENLAQEAARNIQSAFADFLFDPFDKGVKGMLLSFLEAIRRMLAEAIAFQILTGIPGLNKLLPTRAEGGPAFGPTLVGERGPEIVNLPRGSRVMNNSASKASGGLAMGSNGMQFTTHIDARGADPGLIARLPEIMEQRDKRLMLAMKRFLDTGAFPI